MKLNWPADKRARQAIFLGAHFAAFLMLFGLVILPISDFFADGDIHIAEQRAQPARLEGVASQEANVHAMSNQVDAEAHLDEFLVGSSEGLVNAELQTRLKGFTDSAGARVR